MENKEESAVTTNETNGKANDASRACWYHLEPLNVRINEADMSFAFIPLTDGERELIDESTGQPQSREDKRMTYAEFGLRVCVLNDRIRLADTCGLELSEETEAKCKTILDLLTSIVVEAKIEEYKYLIAGKKKALNEIEEEAREFAKENGVTIDDI